MPPLIDLTGRRFGRLVVERRAPNQGFMTSWWCRCDCGRRVAVLAVNLKAKDRTPTQSCGCWAAEVASETFSRIQDAHCRKVPRSELPKIRRRVAAGERQADVAADYGISASQVSRIASGAERSTRDK